MCQSERYDILLLQILAHRNVGQTHNLTIANKPLENVAKFKYSYLVNDSNNSKLHS
jgi:hypothetical protein